MTNNNNISYLFSKKIDNFFILILDIYRFIIRFFKEIWTSKQDIKELTQQCYESGYKSLFLISTIGFITGIVFCNQTRPYLSNFGALSWMPSIISISIVRALAPIITALIAAGKISSHIASELGSMRITEQIDAMEVSAIKPFNFLVVTRTLASTLMIPILTVYAIVISLFGAFINIHYNENISLNLFIIEIFDSISFFDIGFTMFKSILFGFTIGIVGSYNGFYAKNGTQGVGRSSNISFVVSMLLIFFEELFVLQITKLINNF
ncbi:MAG: ABC transporter permease [Bacteroides sp.]|nr:MAG: ABC transporter permease [Bacteroides sp.]